MSRPVDVSAVMRAQAGIASAEGRAGLAADPIQARAAVAELVAAAESVALFAYEPQDMQRLRAALAKFGGAA